MEKNRLYRETNLLEIPAFNIPGKTVRFKMETEQSPRSYKLRGIECACRDALAHGATELLISSGGNAGLAMAFFGRHMNVPVTVALPETIPEEPRQKLREMGATVVVAGSVWDETDLYCKELSKQRPELVYLPPFDHPKLWEGHATMIDELAKQCDEQPDLVIASVGGGMMCGIVEGLIRNGWEDTTVLAVETIGADSLNCAYETGHLVTLDAITSIAKSLGGKCVAAKCLEYAQNYSVIPYRVTDAQAVEACLQFADKARVLVEPACGATLSVILQKHEILKDYRNIVAIVCGGASVTLGMLRRWEEEFIK